MLSQYNPRTALLFGQRFAPPGYDGTEEGYMAGGGYIISKKALKKFSEKLVFNETVCPSSGDGEDEDWKMGNCLAHSAIFVDCRDELHQNRFFPVNVELHMGYKDDWLEWYPKYQYYHTFEGNTSCCSDTSIQFHYIDPKQMYTLEYLIYKAHPFGLVDHLEESLPRQLPLQEIIEASDAPSPSVNFWEHKDFHNLESSEIY